MEWECTEKAPAGDSEEGKSSPLGSDLKVLVNNDKFSDVAFIVGEDKVKMYALKGILSARSKVFCRMFEGGFSEGSMHSIPLPDVDPGLFYKTLDYIYTGALAFDVEEVVDLYAVADRYYIPSLMGECLELIEEHLVPENVTVLYEKAGDANQEPIRERCFRFIMERAEEVFETEEWPDTNYEDVLSIVRSDSLSVPEVCLLKAVLMWGRVDIVKADEALSASQEHSSDPASPPSSPPSILSAMPPPPSQGNVVIVSSDTPMEELKQVLEEVRLPLVPPLYLREIAEPLCRKGMIGFDRLLEAYRFHADASLVGPLESARLRYVPAPALAADGSMNVVRVPFSDFTVAPGKYFKRISQTIDCLLGCQWQLILKNKINPANLSLYVKCSVAKPVPYGHMWRVRDQGMKFGLVNQLNKSKSIWKSWHRYGEDDNKPWRTNKTKYGFGYVIKLSALLEPQSGFIVNNCLIVEVRVPTLVAVETVPM